MHRNSAVDEQKNPRINIFTFKQKRKFGPVYIKLMTLFSTRTDLRLHFENLCKRAKSLYVSHDLFTSITQIFPNLLHSRWRFWKYFSLKRGNQLRIFIPYFSVIVTIKHPATTDWICGHTCSQICNSFRACSYKPRWPSKSNKFAFLTNLLFVGIRAF